MTALATVAGMVPLAMALGAGSQMLQPLAIAVIGGILASMILSLIVTPTVHYFIADRASVIEVKWFGAVIRQGFPSLFSPRAPCRQLGDLLRLLPALVVLQSLAFGQVSLNGRVTDENSVPVAEAHVFLRPSTPTDSQIVPLQTVSDPTGAFIFSVAIPGDYVVSAEQEGYFRLQNQPLLLAEGDNQVTLVLNHQRQLVESVSVAYSPTTIDFDRTSPQTTLTNTEIIDIPYTTTHELRNVMRLMPGTVQDSIGGIHVNGGTEEQVLYTLDGFTINDPLTGRFQSR
jgi:hypothetical protein